MQLAPLHTRSTADIGRSVLPPALDKSAAGSTRGPLWVASHCWYVQSVPSSAVQGSA
jgi:hypothetical protein